MSPEARVGLVTLLGFILVVGTLIFLRGGEIRGRGYDIVAVFANAGGIVEGAQVQMAGVKIGRVRRIELDQANQARVTLTIRPGVRIPQGSRIQVASTGFIGDRYVSIIPGPPTAPTLPPDAQVQGEEPFTVERLTNRLEQIADRVEVLLDNLNTLVGDSEMRGRLTRTLQNVEEASVAARRAAATIDQTAGQFQRLIARDGAAVTADLRRMSRILVATAAQVQAFVDEVSGDGAFARDLKDTVATIRQTAGRVDRMAKALQGLINEENVSRASETLTEARATVREARAVVAQANTVVAQVGGVVQRADRLIPRGGGSLGLPSVASLVKLDYEVWYAHQMARHGLDLTILPERQRFYRLGVHDIGQSGTIVLQAGQRLSHQVAVRGGVFESQVGVGLDYRVIDPLQLSADLYNVNRPTVDLVARYRFAQGWSLSLGGKSLLYQPSILLGVGKSF